MTKTAQNYSLAVLSETDKDLTKDSGEEDDNLNFLLSVYDCLNNFYLAINRLDYMQNNFFGALRKLDLQTKK
jgi:hypothetical protein